MTTQVALPSVRLGLADRRRLLINVTPFAGIVLVLIAAAITTPEFYSRASLLLVLFQVGFIGVTAVGQTFVLITGGIDLSIGAVIGLTTVLVATDTSRSGASLVESLAWAVVGGVVVGAANAALVVIRRVPPFVATFATFVLVQGFITAWTKGAPSGATPAALHQLGVGKWLGIPVPAWMFVFLAVGSAIVLSRTSAGRRLYATGANRRATELSGVRSRHIIFVVYIVAALSAVLAGLIDAGYVGQVDAQLARNLNLDSIAAAVIGGVALTGGRGHMGHAVLGVLLLAVLVVWMVQLGAGAGGQLLVEGAAIMLAALLQRFGQQR